MTDLQETLLKQREFIFRQFEDGMWHCINHDFAGTPADLADEFGIAVPDSAQFLRCILDWDNIGFEFRHYSGLIRINIYTRR